MMGASSRTAAVVAVPRAPVRAGGVATPVGGGAPGIIRVDKPRYGLGLAGWRPPGPSALFDDVCSLMRLAGFAVTPYSDAPAMKWTKLLMNMLGLSLIHLSEPTRPY